MNNVPPVINRLWRPNLVTEVALRVMHAISKIHWVCTYTIFDLELFPQIAHTRTRTTIWWPRDLFCSNFRHLEFLSGSIYDCMQISHVLSKTARRTKIILA